MFPPGRCILLRRLKGPRPPADDGQARGGTQRQQQQAAPQQAPPQQQAQPPPVREPHGRRRRHGRYSWDAVWVAPEQLTAEGILLSRHQASDHYTARLTAVLSELAGMPATARRQAADSGA